MTPGVVDGPFGGEVTLGEIYRLQQTMQVALDNLTTEVRDRHHDLAGKVETTIVPIATLQIRMKSAEDSIERHERDIKSITYDVTWRSALVSGAVLAAGWIISFLVNVLRH